MNNTNLDFFDSTLTLTIENKLLQTTNTTAPFIKKWIVVPLLLLAVQSSVLSATTDYSSFVSSISALVMDNNTISTKLDTSYKPAPKYRLSKEFTAKGINRTAADFQNFYLQVVAANNKAAIDDELTIYKTFVSTHLGRREDSTPWRIFIGPFHTRAEAKIYKLNNPKLVSEDAFPCPAHIVEPIITRSFWKD